MAISLPRLVVTLEFMGPMAQSWVEFQLEKMGLELEKATREELVEFFDLLKEHEKSGLIEEIVNYMQQHPNAKSEEIADKFKVFKRGDKRGRDTIPITMLKRAIKILEDEAKWEN